MNFGLIWDTLAFIVIGSAQECVVAKYDETFIDMQASAFALIQQQVEVNYSNYCNKYTKTHMKMAN